jgi:hypothetical protein
MMKQQPKHRSPRQRLSNHHVAEIWEIAFFLSGVALVPIIRCNNVFGLITLSWWSTFFDVIVTLGVLWVMFAATLAVFTMWNLEREARNSAQWRDGQKVRR